MSERYVISIKAGKNVMGNKCEEWRYAGIDSGSHGSGYPCWCYSDHDCKSFNSVESAKEWFNETKSFLLNSYYDKDELDIKTLGIRIVIYKKVESL